MSEADEPQPNIDYADLLGIMTLQLKFKKKAVLPPDCVVEIVRTRKADASTVRTKLDHVRLVNTKDAVFLWGQDLASGEKSVVRLPWSGVQYQPGLPQQVYETESEMICIEPIWLEELIR